jgi:hypothetical protein
MLCAIFVLGISGSAQAAHTPSISLSSTTVSIGDRVTVQGKHFKGRKKCTLSVNGGVVASGRTSKKGRLRASFTVPQNAGTQLTIELACGKGSAKATIAVSDGDPNANGSSGADGSDITDTAGGDADDDPPAFEAGF